MPPQLQPPNVVEFAKKLDSLLDLLDTTADSLAAEWDLRAGAEGIEADPKDGGFGPTIQ